MVEALDTVVAVGGVWRAEDFVGEAALELCRLVPQDDLPSAGPVTIGGAAGPGE